MQLSENADSHSTYSRGDILRIYIQYPTLCLPATSHEMSYKLKRTGHITALSMLRDPIEMILDAMTGGWIFEFSSV